MATRRGGSVTICGIAGYAFNQKPKGENRARLAAALAILSAEIDTRGGHGWGYATDRDTLKRGLGPLAGAIDVYPVSAARVVILHARYATVGARVKENSHPFRFGHITGAHNGGVWNHQEIARRYGRDFPVDSMHLIAHLAEGRPLSELTGYGAVEFIDANKSGAVGLFRFNRGDLSLADVSSADGRLRGCMWASTSAQLRRGIAAAGFVATPRELLEGRVYYVFDGELYESDQRVDIGAQRYTTVRSSNSWFNGDADPDEDEEPPVVIEVKAKKEPRAKKQRPAKPAQQTLALPVPVKSRVRYDTKDHRIYLDENYGAANDASAKEGKE